MINRSCDPIKQTASATPQSADGTDRVVPKFELSRATQPRGSCTNSTDPSSNGVEYNDFATHAGLGRISHGAHIVPAGEYRAPPPAISHGCSDRITCIRALSAEPFEGTHPESKVVTSLLSRARHRANIVQPRRWRRAFDSFHRELTQLTQLKGKREHFIS